MANKKISELPYINGGKISGNTLVPLVTYFSATTGDTVHTYVSDLQTYLTSGITGNTVVGDFLPLSGGTVTGQTFFTSGLTITGDTIIIDSTGSATTLDTSTRELVDPSSIVSVDWGQRNMYDDLGTSALEWTSIKRRLYDSTATLSVDWILREAYDETGIEAFAWTTSKRKLLDVTSADAVNWNDRLLTKSDGVTISFDWENGILTGQTNIESSTISATTYLNLPSSNFTGGTVSGATNFTNGLTANTISATTYLNLPAGFTGEYLPLSGGTVTGGTVFTSGVTANTISQTSYIDFTTGATNPSAFAGRLFFDSGEKALSYFDIINNTVPIAMGQQLYTRVWNNTGSQIDKGKVIAITGTSNNLPSAILAVNNHAPGSDRPIGVAAENIPSGSEGLVINNGILSGITINTFSNGDTLYLSDTIPGGYVSSTSSFSSFTARTNEIGYVIQTGTTTGKLYVNINNEDSNLTLTDIERNILEGNVISTGAYEYTGMTINSSTTINVAPMRGWIVKNTYEFATLPDVINLNYSGQTGITITNIATADATYVLVNSASTLYQQTTYPTPQQRRENIFLGKVVHPNRTSLLTVNNTVDYDVSPMSALRDLWSPIKLINQGVLPSFNTGLTFNTSLGSLYGNGIGWTTNQLNPNSVTISAKTSASFFYRTQTGGTSGSVSVIDPTKYDVNGVITSVGTAGSNDATNQRIYLYPTGVINVLYGQTRYTTLTEAIANIDSETFVTYPNAETTAILIGVISVRNDIVDDGQPLTNTNYAKLTLVSKFGESFGGTGGLSTTNLQQAYNNSTEPEILINSTLDGLSIQNGTGNADNVTQLLQGKNTAGTTTSFIRADGFISGNSLNAPNLIISGGTQSIFSGDSSSDLVRITQTGSGNAFVVEDITNPDSTPFVIDTSGNTGIGVTVPDSKLHISNTGTSPTSVSLKLIGTGTSEQFLFYRDGSSLINSTTSGSTNTINNGTSLRTFVNSLGFQFLDASGYGFHHTTSFGGLNVGNTNGYLYLWSQASDTLRLFLGGQDRNPTVARTRTVINPVPSSSTLFSPTGGTSIDYSFQNAGQSVFSPTGGTASYTQIELKPSYSGTGSYSGTVTGLLYNPNLLSMSGTTHRAIQTTTGDVIFGSTSGNVGIGTTTPRQRLDVNGNTIISSGLTAQTGVFSSSSQNVLTVIGSGNSTTSPLFSVQGSSGELFSVTDSLVGSLFSVNDISGLPIVEVFSDNTTLWGSYQAPSLNTTTRTSLTAGTNTIYSIPTSAYTGAFYEYTLISTGTTGARAGQIMSIWSGTSANFTETSTLDIGTTTGVTFTVAVSGSNAVLSSSATTAGWTVKTIIRSI